MATQSLGMIGLFVPTFFGSYYGTILKQTDAELRAVHRHVVVATGCGESSPREQAMEAVEFLIGRDCDGVIVDSEPVSNRVTAQALTALGWPMTADEADRWFQWEPQVHPPPLPCPGTPSHRRPASLSSTTDTTDASS